MSHQIPMHTLINLTILTIGLLIGTISMREMYTACSVNYLHPDCQFPASQMTYHAFEKYNIEKIYKLKKTNECDGPCDPPPAVAPRTIYD